MSVPAVWVYLTLTQPWATLMAIGAKVNETRGWRTHYRGWFAIHAGKGFPRGCQELCFLEPFKSALAAAGYHHPDELPRGRILAVTELIDCIQITLYEHGRVRDPERSFGDYSVGRYAFVTEGVRRLRNPIAMRGLQRFQKIPPPIAPIRAGDLL